VIPPDAAQTLGEHRQRATGYGTAAPTDSPYKRAHKVAASGWCSCCRDMGMLSLTAGCRL